MNKKWLYLVILIIAAFLGFYLFRKYRVAPEIDLAKLDVVDLDNRQVALSSYKGKKMVVCFSASWCGNCRQELDEIKSLNSEDMKDVEVVVISDEPLEKVKVFKERREYPFTFLKMNASFQDIGIHSIPTSYIVNTDFKIRKETVGYLNWRDPSTFHHLKTLME